MASLRTASGTHRVRFSSASPARHTYSSSGEDSDDPLEEEEDYFPPDPGPSRPIRRPVQRQSLPADFTINKRSLEPTRHVQPPPPPPPPPRRNAPSTSASTPITRQPTQSTQHGRIVSSGSSKGLSNSNGSAYPSTITTTTTASATAKHKVAMVPTVQPSQSPQSVSSEQMEQMEHMSFSALERSLPKAPPSQRTPSTSFFKSNNPFRKRHASQPTLPTIVDPGLSAPRMPPPPPPPLPQMYKGKSSAGSQYGGGSGAINGHVAGKSTATTNTVITIASGATTTLTGKDKGKVPAHASNVAAAPAPRLPPRRQSMSGPPPVAPPPPPALISSKPSKPHKKSRASVASSVSSINSYDMATSTSNPSAIIKKSLLAAEQAREARTQTMPITVVRPWEPTRAENPISAGRGIKPSRSGSVRALSPLGSPEPSVKGKKVRSPSGSVRNAEIINSVHTALMEASLDETTPKPPARKVAVKPKVDDFTTIAKGYQAHEPGIKLWNPGEILTVKGKRRARYAMIILNQPITRKDVFLRAWAASDLHYCADGGANRLYDLWETEQRVRYLPDMIKGDLDSLRSDVSAFYSARGVSIKHDSSEYSTDLMKCIEEVETKERQTDQEYSLIFIGGLSGRVDQTVHTMSMLHKLRKTRPSTYVLSSESLAWTLDKGSHLIEIDHSTMGQTCGILPIGVDSSMVKTQGLKWNLEWETSLDGDVSTSNHLLPSEPVVYLNTSRPVLWCVEIKPHLETPAIQAKSQREREREKERSVISPVEDISRGISDLGVGMVRVAGQFGNELGKDLDWLKGGRGGRKLSMRTSTTKEERAGLINGAGTR